MGCISAPKIPHSIMFVTLSSIFAPLGMPRRLPKAGGEVFRLPEAVSLELETGGNGEDLCFVLVVISKGTGGRKCKRG